MQLLDRGARVRQVGAQRAALALGRVAGLRARGQLLLLVRHDRRLAPRALARRLQLALRACRAGVIRALSNSADQASDRWPPRVTSCDRITAVR
jgi:hypothetical protein